MTATILSGRAPLRLRGFCRRCAVDHVFDNDADAGVAALAAFFADAGDVDRALLDASPGKMVGVLVVDGVDGVDGGGEVLRAYSGDLGGAEDQPGWAPCLVRRSDTAALQQETWAIVNAAASTAAQTKRASQRLMTAMLAATVVESAGGVGLSVVDVVGHARLPSGTGDCALPKLFVAAHKRRARPVGFAEAWWGPAHGERRHGALQQPCAARCAPLIGHLLCPIR